MHTPIPPPTYIPTLPPIHDYGIAVVGCGGIVNYAHLPAYRNHGLTVVGCFDRDGVTAQETATRHHIPRVYATLTALLADPAVHIVDIAVPAWEQRAIAEQALAAGKHLLCQKPLAENLADARAIMTAGEHAQRWVAVNQQMRWSAGIAASADLIRRGVIGQPTDAQIWVSANTPWHMWPWLRDSVHLDIMYHSIHYLDSLRHLFGNPALLTSRHGRYPGQPELAETKTTTILEYADGLQATVMVNHHDASTANAATFRFLGTEGIITGTIGSMYDYPHGRTDTLGAARHGAALVDVPLSGLWIPDAFIGPMASLMHAMQSNTPPITSARDNIFTLQLVHGAYLSAAEARTIAPDSL